MLCRLRDGELFAVALRYYVSVTTPGDAALIARGEPGEVLVVSEGGDFAFLSKQEFDRMFEPVPASIFPEKVSWSETDDGLPAVKFSVGHEGPWPASPDVHPGSVYPPGALKPDGPLDEVKRIALEALREEQHDDAPKPGPIQIQNPISLGVPYPVTAASRAQVSLLQRVREALAGTKVGFTREELQELLEVKGGKRGKISMSLSYLKKHGDVFFVPETRRWSLTNSGRIAERERRLGSRGEKGGPAA